MKKILLLSLVLFTLLINSCRKHDEPVLTAYQFETIDKSNFSSLNWKKQQVNVSGTTTFFSDESKYVEIVCGLKTTAIRGYIKAV